MHKSVSQGAVLTAKRRLVGSIRTVSLAIAHLSLGDTHLVCGTQPQTRRAAEWRSGTACLIAHIPAIVITVTNPALGNAVSIGTLEVCGSAGARWAAVVFVRAIFTVRMTVTFPHFWNTESVDLALELIVMAETGSTCGCICNKLLVFNSIILMNNY